MAVNATVRPLVGAALAVAVALGVLWRGPHIHGAAAVPLIRIGGVDRPEACLRCHADVRGLGPAHDPSALGCSSCHLGDPLALDEQAAHRGMLLFSGDLARAEETCGQPSCHPSEAGRVSKSVMAGAAALLGVDAFAFGERERPEVRPSDDLRRVAEHDAAASPAEDHVRKLCASCHLGYPKSTLGDQGFDARGGGCIACHLAPPDRSAASGQGRLHPDVSANVPEARCEGCHSRSGRIALSYRGKVELEPGDPRVTDALPDGRPIGRTDGDVHARAGMGCIDCHTERDVMGDGQSWQHGYQAVGVRCEDCHGRASAQGAARAELAPASEDATRVAEVLRRAWRRRGRPDVGGAPILTEAGIPLWRTDRARAELVVAETGKSLAIPRTSEARHHTMRGHERLSCQACHSRWAPRCTSCHTSYRADGRQVDHLTGRESQGEWLERAGGNGFGPPLLALGPRGTIAPFLEGMTLQIDGLARPVDRVLWAPLDPHTTGPARDCASCHAPSGLAEVAPAEGETTRIGARLLDGSERERLDRVGRCVACHRRYEDPIYVDFEGSVDRLAQLRRDQSAEGHQPRSADPAERALWRCAGTPPPHPGR